LFEILFCFFVLSLQIILQSKQTATNPLFFFFFVPLLILFVQLHLCKTGSILNSLSQTCPELSALHYRASHLLLFVFLDSISEKPLLRNPGKRKKALEALQKAAMKLRSIMRKITWKK